ncbi:hypothetical protein HDU78_006871 [Chytriomyces hyalinus]|nr:hypothetical protein HDU78_006871 [Chytriomyces hyalinus]
MWSRCHSGASVTVAFILVLLAFVVQVKGAVAFASGEQQRTVNVLLLPTMKNISLEKSLTQEFMDTTFTPKTGIKVVIHMTATRITTDYATQLQLYLSSNDSSMDIFMMDVVWPPEFAEYLIDLSPMISPELAALHNPAIWKANVVDGRHIGIPFHVDYGLFYYRDDLLAKHGYTGPPETWDEMEAMALDITSKEPSVAGYVGQFNAYEGLTCNLMEWLHSADAGAVISPNQTVTLDNPSTRQMLSRVKNWFMNGVTPKYALSYAEIDCEDIFQSGQALFMRHWPPTMLSLQRAGIKFSFKVTGLPGTSRETKFASTLGGWNLGVSKATKNHDAAVSALLFMATAEFQKFRFMAIGLFPSVSSLYQDPEVCTKIDCQLFRNLRVSPRPAAGSGKHYLEVSRILYTAVNSYLGQKIDINTALEDSVLRIEETIGTYAAVVMAQARYIHYEEGIAKVFTTLAFTGVATCLALMVFVCAYRKNPVMVAASPDFLCLIIFGAMIEFGAICLFVGKPTASLCLAQPFAVTLGYAIAYSALLTKTWRVHRIFDAKFAKVGRSLTSSKLMKYVGIYVAVNLAILLAWAFTKAPHATAIFQNSRSAYLACTSDADTPFTAILLSLNGLMLLFGSWLAYKTRNIDKEYRESYYIAIIMYNTLIWGCISAGFVFVAPLGHELHFSVRSVSILMVCFGTLILLMVPKIRAVFHGALPVINTSSEEMRRQSVAMQQSSFLKKRPSQACDLDKHTTDVVCVDYRMGKSTLFLGNWRAAKLNLVELKDGLLVAFTKAGKKGKLVVGVIFFFFLDSLDFAVC